VRKRILWIVSISLLLLTAYEYQPARYYALLCLDKNAEPGGNWNSAYDGYFLAENGCFYDPAKVAVKEIPAFHLDSTNRDATPIWYINGANLRADWVLAQMYRLAESSGRPVIAIYNSTLGGRFFDAAWDALQGSVATVSAEKVIIEALAQQEDIFFQVNSQGAIHMATVLRNISRQVQAKQLNKIHVLTAGGAAPEFPDGPGYVHLINKKDPVPSRAGVVSKDAKPGANAELIHFSAKDSKPMERDFRFVGPLTRAFLSVHGFMAYQKHFPESFQASRAAKTR